VKKSRKIIVYIATSADGYIARPNGNVSNFLAVCEVLEQG
jgi:hypothetical protein